MISTSLDYHHLIPTIEACNRNFCRHADSNQLYPEQLNIICHLHCTHVSHRGIRNLDQLQLHLMNQIKSRIFLFAVEVEYLKL